MAQFVLKIEKLSHIMGPTPILEIARAYGLHSRLWLLLVIIWIYDDLINICVNVLINRALDPTYWDWDSNSLRSAVITEQSKNVHFALCEIPLFSCIVILLLFWMTIYDVPRSNCSGLMNKVLHELSRKNAKLLTDVIHKKTFYSLVILLLLLVCDL